MKLNEKDRQVAAYVYFNGQANSSEIAREIGLREHTVRRSLSKMEDNKILVESTYINPMAAGFIEIESFIKVQTPGEQARKKLLEIFEADERVDWVSALGGEYHLDVMFLVKSVDEITDFYDDIYEQAKDIDFSRSTVSTISLTYYPPHYLGSYEQEKDSLTVRKPDQVYPVNDLDHKILSGLCSVGFRNQKKLARNLGIPSSTLSYRIENLKKQGVILGFGLMLVPYADEMAPHILLLRMRRVDPDIRQKLFEFGCENLNTTYLIENFGAYDFQIGIRLSDSRKLPVFMQEFKKLFCREIDEVVVVPVFDFVKLKNYPMQEYRGEKN